LKHSNNSYDYLIIGQGIAGTMLSYQALKRNKSFKLIDNSFKHSASKISSGVINPVTGRKIVKTWMIEELMEKARTIYEDISSILGRNIIKFAEITRLIKDAEEENIWTSKALNESVSYLTEIGEAKPYEHFFKNFKSVGKISPALVIDIETLLIEWKHYLSVTGNLIESQVERNEIVLNNDRVRYQDMQFSTIIFADGQQGLSREFFEFLNYEDAKGDVIYIKSDEFHCDEMLKTNINIIPLKNEQYWIGSNYEWNPKDDKPSESIKESFISKLNKSVTFNYEVIDHKSAIRACTKDRKPYIGIHPDHAQLVIFNGLGTKGMSLAPYFSEHLFDHLEDNIPLMAEVDIQRVF